MGGTDRGGHMNITIHIERLVLEGFSEPAVDTTELRAAVVGELTRLFASGAVLPPQFTCGLSVPGLRGADIASSALGGGSEFGRRAAASLHEGLTQTPAIPRGEGPL